VCDKIIYRMHGAKINIKETVAGNVHYRSL